MTDVHPLEQLLRNAKEKDDLNAAAVLAEQTNKIALQDKVRLQWGRTKANLVDEIERANAVLEKHNLRERYAFRELPESGGINIARGSLALSYPSPSRSPRSEYDLTVLAADGRILLVHRTTGQQHQRLTVFTASGKSWETILTGLYQDHLKKGREPMQNVPEPSALAPEAGSEFQ